MRAVVIHEHGGRDKLILDDVPDPVPAAGEILLRVKAVGLNYLDIFVRRGMPGLPIDLPRISGDDIAGKVVATGEGVTSVKVGQRLLIDPAITMRDGTGGALGESATGGLSEYFAISTDNAIPLPDDVPMSKPPPCQSHTARRGACSLRAASSKPARASSFSARAAA